MSETFYQIQYKHKVLKGRWKLIPECKNGRGSYDKIKIEKIMKKHEVDNPNFNFRIKESKPKTVWKYKFALEDGRTATFSAKGRKRVVDIDSFVLVNCDIELADGTRLDAVCAFDESSSGEHYSTYILLPEGHITAQGDEDFFEKLGKTREQIFPYRYRKRAELHCHDHHVDEKTGWSPKHEKRSEQEPGTLIETDPPETPVNVIIKD